MDLGKFFKSIIEQDRCAVVICNLEHEIIYMNPSAIERYGKRGGAALVGQSLLNCHSPKSSETIKKVVSWFVQSHEHNIMYTFRNEKENKDVYMVALRDDDGTLIGYYEKHEYRDMETALSVATKQTYLALSPYSDFFASVALRVLFFST